jgi:prostaglandin reductase 1
MTKARIWVTANALEGFPKITDFAIKEQELEPLKDKEFLCKAEYLSIDPYQRLFASMLPLGSTIVGYQVAEIIESKDEKFPVGRRVIGHFGWRSHTIAKAGEETQPYLMPELPDLPNSAFIGLLGLPGMSAYFGFITCCLPKPGETLVVNAAAGAVGSTVGQIARIMGCRVIGYAGEDSKLEWLKNELGFEQVFNYKKVDLDKSLSEAAPNGVDCFFDNVGGSFATTVYKHMNRYGRICQCGSISSYNETESKTIPDFYTNFFIKELTLKGYFYTTNFHQWPEATKVMGEWIKQGKLKLRETVVDGFDNLPQALIDSLHGKNTGKMIVKASLG